MENEIKTKINLYENLRNKFIKYKKLSSVILFIILAIIVGASFYSYNKKQTIELISEKFIKAGIYYSSKQNEKSKNLYKEVVLSKNKFYSLLALNSLIDNNLEQDHNEIIKLFNKVENLRMDKDQKNLLKLKKALYLIKISKGAEGKKLLQQIIDENSVWTDAALEILK